MNTRTFFRFLLTKTRIDKRKLARLKH